MLKPPIAEGVMHEMSLFWALVIVAATVALPIAAIGLQVWREGNPKD